MMTLTYSQLETPPTVLVVDDNPDLVDIFSRFLARKGFKVVPAYSGPECLEKAAQWTIDAIVLDVMMPGMDGLEVCAALKKTTTTCAIPIILLTAWDDARTCLAAMRLGVSELVVKPASIQDIFARLQVHVECSRKAREMDRVLTDGILEATVYGGDAPVLEMDRGESQGKINRQKR